MAVWAYARVSSNDQNVDRQIDSLLPLVTTKSHLIIEKQSGKDFERPKWKALKDIMNEHDTLIIKSLDRLGRNYLQIKEEWKEITDKGIYIKVLDNPLLDTSVYADNNLMAQFTSNIILEVLSFVAENERKNIHQRQKEGIASAKLRGVKFGRPAIQYPKEWEHYYFLWKNNKITAVQFMKAVDLKKTSFYKLVKEYNSKKCNS